jgi:sulfite reductase beta subunit-like hemoprotein
MAASVEDTLTTREAFEKKHDTTVREEIERFRQKAASYLAGEISDDQFKPFRLKHGIYGQRQPGVQMVRCKIPGGLATSRQIEQLARIADQFAGGKAHLTTRQNVQYHFVPLSQVADVMTLLADVGMTNREACYNTVRNVTTCAWAGIARDEVFDVRPYAQKVAYAFLRKDLTSELPRKFKLAFDGCAGSDCIAGAINDIGVRALIRDGKVGALAGATVSVSAGALLATAPMGPGASQTKVLANGYDDTYAVYRLVGAADRVAFTFTPRAGTSVKSPIFVIEDYGSNQLPAISVGGAPRSVNTGSATSGAFVSLDGANRRLWVTLNDTIATATEIVIGP